MKRFQKSVVAMVLVLPLAFYSCNEEADCECEEQLNASNFLATLNQDPTIVDDEKLGDSWRVARIDYDYMDGEYVKEGTVDFLYSADSECPNYKEFWLIGKDQVMFVFEGDCYGKSWDGNFKLFDHQIDLENKVISIDYVYDDGEKTYTRDWVITELSTNKLVLTDERPDDDYFYQYTFIREVFK